MKYEAFDNARLPTILMVQDSERKIELNSHILSVFNIVYSSGSHCSQFTPRITESARSHCKKQLNSELTSQHVGSQDTEILTWIQQNQPDLIVIEYASHPESYSNLITPLKLDWLTRNIPIVIVCSRFFLKSIENLDYDACLNSPYSEADLNKAICSLIRLPICHIFAG